MTDRIHIAHLGQHHVNDVMQIVAQCYAFSDRPTLQQWRDWACPGRHRGMSAMVAMQNRAVVGVATYGLGPHVIWLETLAVKPMAWRRGIGTYMLGALKTILTVDAQTVIQASVRETNDAAHLFLRANAFRCTRQWRGNFEDTGEDEHQFEYVLPAALPEWHPTNRIGNLLSVEE